MVDTAPKRFTAETDRDRVRKFLLDDLSRSTPFEVGRAMSQDGEWNWAILPLDDEPPVIEDGGIHSHHWSVRILDREKWLFLHLDLEDSHRSFIFAFDCDSPKHAMFLKGLAQTKRVSVIFPNKKGVRLDPNPYDSLVEAVGGEDVMKKILPSLREVG